MKQFYEILLGENANKLANLSLHDLFKMEDAEELVMVANLTHAEAEHVVGCIQTAKQMLIARADRKPVFTSAQQGVNYLRPRLAFLNEEKFLIVALNSQCRVIDVMEISSSVKNAVYVPIDSIFRFAILKHATSIVVAHNHPSGNLTPSTCDKRVTAHIAKGGKILDIPLLDHIIISGNEYFSFQESGLMPETD